MSIDVVNVTKQFKAFKALDRVSLHIPGGELVALLGPSGSGKTTLLRIIAGLDWPDSGEVRFDGQDALSRSVGERNVGFVFQHYALFRHMSVFENVAFGLRVRKGADKLPEAKIRERVNELLSLVQIDWLADRYPGQLSGGQRQRVALARALAISPRVLLLDEPFGALDAKVRKELRRWLRHLHEELPVTSVLVTHDQEEALELADTVVVMGRGRIEQVGTPAEVYDRPATAFVHDFIGESLSLPADVRDGALYVGDRQVPLDSQGVASGPARILARPHDVELAPAGEAPLSGKVLAVRTFGPTRRADIQIHGGNVVVEAAVPHGDTLPVGTAIGLVPRRYRVFAPAGGNHAGRAMARPAVGPSPGGQIGALEALHQEHLHLVRVIGVDELLHPGLVLVLFSHRQDVHPRPVHRLSDERVLGRVEARLDGVIVVDGGGIHVRQRARQLGGVQLDEFQLLRVFDDVDLAGGDARAGPKLDDAVIFQDLE